MSTQGEPSIDTEQQNDVEVEPEESEPPMLECKVKVEPELEDADACNYLELHMEAEVHASIDGDEDDGQCFDDVPPPILQPEVTFSANSNVDTVVQPEGGVQGSLWYQCRYCAVLLEDAMLFLFHIRLHEGSSASLEDSDNDPVRLENQLTQAGVTIFSPTILTPRIEENDVTFDMRSTQGAQSSEQLNDSLPPMPRLTRAPTAITVNQHASQVVEDLPRKCKLCTPHLTLSKRSEFIDHLFTQHRGDSQFHCSKSGCGFRTRSVQFLEKHVDEHDEDTAAIQPRGRVYICHLCKPKTKWLQSTRYAVHMRDQHLQEDGTYQCLYCNYSTPGLQLFNKHVKKTHPETMTFVSGPVYGKAFPPRNKPRPRPVSNFRLLQRRPTLPIDRQFLCYFCSKSWESRKQYESHMILRHRNARGRYNCFDCNFVGDSIRLIARHFKYRHGTDSHRKEFVQVDDHEEQGSADDYLPDEEEYEDEEMDYNVPPFTPPPPSHTVQVPTIQNQNRGPKNPLVLQPPPLPKDEIDCPLCSLEKSEPTPHTNMEKYFDHIFQNHCRDNAVYCSHCTFRSTSLETTVHHALIVHCITKPPTPPPAAPVLPPPPPPALRRALVPPELAQAQPPPPGSSKHFCRFCRTNWSEVSSYSNHMKKHLDVNGNFNCPYCYLPYPTLNRFNEHVKRRHEMLQPPSRLDQIRKVAGVAQTMQRLPPMVQRPERAELPAQSASSSSTSTSVTASSASLSAPPLPRTSRLAAKRKRAGLVGVTRRRRYHLTGTSYMQKSYACFYCVPDGLSFQSVKLYSRHMRQLHMNRDGFYSCPICPELNPTTLKKINEHMKRKTHPALMKKAKIGVSQTMPTLSKMVNQNTAGPATAQVETKHEQQEETGQREKETSKIEIAEDSKMEVDKVDTAPEFAKTESSPTRSERTESSASTDSSRNNRKWFQCKACFILVETKEKLMVHQRTHFPQQQQHPNPTQVVDKPRPTRVETEVSGVNGEVHKSRSPSGSPSPPTLPLQMPLHKCRACDPVKWFRTQEEVDRHMTEHHHRTPRPASPEKRTRVVRVTREVAKDREAPKEGRTMTCLYCYTVFNNQKTYIKHVNSEHADETGCFKCPTCKIYTTPLLSRATKHMRRHFQPDASKKFGTRRKKVKRSRSKVQTVDVGTAIEGLKVAPMLGQPEQNPTLNS